MAIGTLTIGPNTTVDFLYITTGAVTDDMKNDLNYEPIWDEDSKFLAKFDHTLRTGNLDAEGNPPTSWAVYRQKVGSNILEYVTTVEGEEGSGYDYMPSNGVEYIYHSFARTESDMSEDKQSKPIKPSWPGWFLMTLKESANDPSLFEPDEIFCFQYNLEIGDLNNNTTFNKLENFTQYPFIQRSSSNHLSGSLKGLIGVVDGNARYYDTLEQANALQRLTTNTQRKLLKDLHGHVMEVDLMGSMMFSILPSIEFEPYSATVQWVEVADASDLRVMVDTSAEMTSGGSA